MSRLWPDSIVIGLFPGQCWLRRGRHVLAASASALEPTELLSALAAMLTSLEKPLRKGSRVHVLVSDALAAILPLPWQVALVTPQEMQGYARACFDQQGIHIDESWAVATAFRHYGATGLAFAISDVWLRELLDLLAGRQLRVSSILPACLAAYWRAPNTFIGRRALLLHEPQRLSALVYDGKRLLGHDVQPLLGAAELGVTRLLRRIAITHGSIKRIDQWQAWPGPTIALGGAFNESTPELEIRVHGLLAWN